MKRLFVFILLLCLLFVGCSSSQYNTRVELNEEELKVAEIVYSLKQDLKDPDSIKVYEIRITEDRKYVYIDYGAKNSMVGMVRSVTIYEIDTMYCNGDSGRGTDYIKDDFDELDNYKNIKEDKIIKYIEENENKLKKKYRNY